MKRTINMTIHTNLTQAQIDNGIENPSDEIMQKIKNFTNLTPDKFEYLDAMSSAFVELIYQTLVRSGYDYAMIGSGAPIQQAHIMRWIKHYDLEQYIVFAYSQRVCEESLDDDGNVVKRYVSNFTHLLHPDGSIAVAF